MDQQTDKSSTNFDHNYRKLPASFLSRIITACSSPNLYVFPLSEGTRSTIAYLFKLLLIIAAIQVLTGSYFVWTISGTVGENLINQWPEVHFQNGDLRLQNQTPYRLDIYQDFQIIIDPEGNVNRARLEDNVLAVAVNGRLFARSGPGEFMDFSTRYYEDTGAAPEMLIDANFISDWLPYFRVSLLFTLGGLTLLELLLSSLLRIVLISSGGLVARNNETARLGWGQILLVSCYAVTPVLIIQTVLFPLRFTGIIIPYAEFITLLAGIIWVFFTISRFQKRARKREPGIEPHRPEE